MLAPQDLLSAPRMPSTREGRLRRRLRTIPRVVGLSALVALTLPLLLLVAASIDAARWLTRRTPAMGLRLLSFLVVYLCAQLVGLGALLFVWLRAGPGAAGRARLLAGTYAVQGAWAAALLAAVVALFRLRIVVEGGEAARPGPLLVFVRHVSIIDTLLPTVLLTRGRGVRLRFVLKRELLEDPCLDVAGCRLPNHFVRRRGEGAAGEIEAVRRLSKGLQGDEGVLIYPEGTRFSPAKREAALERLRREDPAQHALMAPLERVLPLKVGGALAMLEGAPCADLLFFAHAGLEGFAKVEDLWSGALVGRTLAVRLWRVPRAEVPDDDAGRVRLLCEQWARVDAHVAMTTAEAS